MMTLDDLQQAIGGQWLAAPPTRDAAAQRLGRVTIHSRQVEQGEVFWALRGPRYDGVDFVDEAFSRGAAGAVVGLMPSNRSLSQSSGSRSSPGSVPPVWSGI